MRQGGQSIATRPTPRITFSCARAERFLRRGRDAWREDTLRSGSWTSLVPFGLRDFGRREIALQQLRAVSASRAFGGVLSHGLQRSGSALDQRVKILRVERQQFGLARRRHRAAALGTVQQRDFAEERAVRKPDPLARQFDLDLARGDEIHR